mmetsp:Transcript_19997/g.66157  ORF Transcript_19997/g.66157 Transcript_19997/m.66157 type:complete len:610 (+) Transcript_19997:328-2157(+)
MVARRRRHRAHPRLSPVGCGGAARGGRARRAARRAQRLVGSRGGGAARGGLPAARPGERRRPGGGGRAGPRGGGRGVRGGGAAGVRRGGRRGAPAPVARARRDEQPGRHAARARQRHGACDGGGLCGARSAEPRPPLRPSALALRRGLCRVRFFRGACGMLGRRAMPGRRAKGVLRRAVQAAARRGAPPPAAQAPLRRLRRVARGRGCSARRRGRGQAARRRPVAAARLARRAGAQRGVVPRRGAGVGARADVPRAARGVHLRRRLLRRHPRPHRGVDPSAARRPGRLCRVGVAVGRRRARRGGRDRVRKEPRRCAVVGLAARLPRRRRRHAAAARRAAGRRAVRFAPLPCRRGVAAVAGRRDGAPRGVGALPRRGGALAAPVPGDDGPDAHLGHGASNLRRGRRLRGGACRGPPLLPRAPRPGRARRAAAPPSRQPRGAAPPLPVDRLVDDVHRRPQDAAAGSRRRVRAARAERPSLGDLHRLGRGQGREGVRRRALGRRAVARRRARRHQPAQGGRAVHQPQVARQRRRAAAAVHPPRRAHARHPRTRRGLRLASPRRGGRGGRDSASCERARLGRGGDSLVHFLSSWWRVDHHDHGSVGLRVRRDG